MNAARTLQLYIFEAAPRRMPPFTQIREGWRLETLVRAVRRAAAHPWRDARFWRNAADHIAAAQPAEVTGRDLAQGCLAFRRGVCRLEAKGSGPLGSLEDAHLCCGRGQHITSGALCDGIAATRPKRTLDDWS